MPYGVPITTDKGATITSNSSGGKNIVLSPVTTKSAEEKSRYVGSSKGSKRTIPTSAYKSKVSDSISGEGLIQYTNPEGGVSYITPNAYEAIKASGKIAEFTDVSGKPVSIAPDVAATNISYKPFGVAEVTYASGRKENVFTGTTSIYGSQFDPSVSFLNPVERDTSFAGAVKSKIVSFIPEKARSNPLLVSTGVRTGEQVVSNIVYGSGEYVKQVGKAVSGLASGSPIQVVGGLGMTKSMFTSQYAEAPTTKSYVLSPSESGTLVLGTALIGSRSISSIYFTGESILSIREFVSKPSPESAANVFVNVGFASLSGLPNFGTKGGLEFKRGTEQFMRYGFESKVKQFELPKSIISRDTFNIVGKPEGMQTTVFGGKPFKLIPEPTTNILGEAVKSYQYELPSTKPLITLTTDVKGNIVMKKEGFVTEILPRRANIPDVNNLDVSNKVLSSKEFQSTLVPNKKYNVLYEGSISKGGDVQFKKIIEVTSKGTKSKLLSTTSPLSVGLELVGRKEYSFFKDNIGELNLGKDIGRSFRLENIGGIKSKPIIRSDYFLSSNIISLYDVKNRYVDLSIVSNKVDTKQSIKVVPSFMFSNVQSSILSNKTISLSLVKFNEDKFININTSIRRVNRSFKIPSSDDSSVKKLFNSFKSKNIVGKYKYSPSIEAQFFNIKGVKPKGYLSKTGLVLRPIIRG